MKLFTTEQAIEMINEAKKSCEQDVELMIFFNIIQIPTDKDIYNNAPFHDGTDYSIGNHHGFMNGAKWMRDKLKGGNQ